MKGLALAALLLVACGGSSGGEIDAAGTVVTRVATGGGSYTMSAWSGGAETMTTEFTSTVAGK